jgi:diguanylate cyclase
LAAERIRTAIGTHPFTLDEVTIQVTISIGIATAPEHGSELRALVKAADEALYRAKETGRNKVCVAGESE